MSDKKHAREKYQEDLTESARKAYAEHQIERSSEGRWLLFRRRDDGTRMSEFWTEIIALEHGGLLVDGDIDPVIFRYGPVDPEVRVRWMGSRKFAHDRYFQEKANTGTGGSLFETWNPDAARDDLLEMEAGLRGESEDSCGEPNLKAADQVAHVREYYLNDGRDCALLNLYEIDGVDSEELGRIGMVTTSRLYYAHAALARLVVLLDARDT